LHYRNRDGFAFANCLDARPMAIVIKQPASMTKESLDKLGPVKAPISSPAAQLVGRKYLDNTPGVNCMGIWECSPGLWTRTIMEEEFAHFILGSATFIPENGDPPITLRAGDSIWFPANSRGVWDIKEDVRKVYVVIDRPTLLKRMKAAIKSLLSDARSVFAKAPDSREPIRQHPERA
jgi:uncharacterized cupin superfamily protein